MDRRATKKALRIGSLVILVMAGLPGCQNGYAGKMETLRLGALPGSSIQYYLQGVKQ